MYKHCCSLDQMGRYNQGKSTISDPLLKWRVKVVLVGQGQRLEEFAALLQPLGVQSAELQQIHLACSSREVPGPPCLLSNARWYQ